MTNLAVDGYNRIDQSGFGLADDGLNTWGAPIGNGLASISGHRGIFGSNNLDSQMICGSHAATTDINMLVKLQTSDLNNVAGVLWRYSSASGGNGYRAGFFAGNLFVIDKYVNGSRSNVLANSITAYSTGVDMWIRLIHKSDGTLQIRWWLDGGSEPSNFNSPFVNQSETSFASGNFGVSVFINSGGTVSYGAFTVTDNQSTITLAVQAQARFAVRAEMAAQARSRFVVRAVLVAPVRAAFVVRATLASPARSRFAVRAPFATPARAAFRIRAALAAQARAAFVVRAGLAARAQARFLIHAIIQAFAVQARARFKITDDPGVAWRTRDNQANWKGRDNNADWRTRG